LGLSLTGKDALRYADLRLPNPVALFAVPWRVTLRRTLVYGSAVVLALIISGGFLALSPLVGISMAHTSGVSMEPLYKQGDMVLLKEISGEDARVGDVIGFEDNGVKVLHRVVRRFTDESGELMLVTQGDNVPRPDRPIHASQVQGRVIAAMPFLGDVSRWLDARGALYVYHSIVITLAVTWIIVWGLTASAKADVRKRESRGED
jgi:signal peptidase I